MPDRSLLGVFWAVAKLIRVMYTCACPLMAADVLDSVT